ncbi:MAG: transglutaminase family protein [Candidatus Bathyarchaeia archaeon]
MERRQLKVLMAILLVITIVHVIFRSFSKDRCYQDVSVYKCRNLINYALTEGTPKSHRDDRADEFVHKIQWDKTSVEELNFSTVGEALSWVHENIIYCYDEFSYGCLEAWATPEATLTFKVVNGSEGLYGDCEDLAILLASLIKFHTLEFKPEEDDAYVRCGFVEVEPGVFGLHAWVVFYDGSEHKWYEIDPTKNHMECIPYPKNGTLWFNDMGVFGFLPGYYPECY